MVNVTIYSRTMDPVGYTIHYSSLIIPSFSLVAIPRRDPPDRLRPPPAVPGPPARKRPRTGGMFWTRNNGGFRVKIGGIYGEQMVVYGDKLSFYVEKWCFFLYGLLKKWWFYHDTWWTYGFMLKKWWFYHETWWVSWWLWYEQTDFQQHAMSIWD